MIGSYPFRKKRRVSVEHDPRPKPAWEHSIPVQIHRENLVINCLLKRIAVKLDRHISM